VVVNPIAGGNLIGNGGSEGGFAPYLLVKNAIADGVIYKVPPQMPFDLAALAEPLAVALHGVMLSGIRPGDRILVLGAGPIGLAVAFWARRAGASRVVVQDIADWQRARAIEMGATEFIVDPEDPVGAAARALDGLADIVFECVGVPGLIAQAVKQVRPRGTILLLGLCNQPDTFNSFAMLTKEVRLVTSAFFKRGEYETALDALERGAPEPRALVTQTIGLAQTPDIFEGLKRRTHQCKVLIAPGE